MSAVSTSDPIPARPAARRSYRGRGFRKLFLTELKLYLREPMLAFWGWSSRSVCWSCSAQPGRRSRSTRSAA